MISLKEEGRTISNQFITWWKKALKQPWEVTKQEVRQFIEENYEKFRELIDEFIAREDVTKALTTIKKSLLWANQTRFQPVKQTVMEVKLFLNQTRDLAIEFYQDFTDREDFKQTVQVFRDYIAREDVNKTLEAIKKILQYANQTRFQPLELTLQEVKMVLEENYIIVRNVIMALPVESNVRKMVEVVKIWANETEVFAVKAFKLGNETFYLVKKVTEENYLKAKDYALEQWHYLKEETPYVEQAQELLQQTREYMEDKIENAKAFAEEMKIATVSMAKDYITYVDGTMAGRCLFAWLL